MNGFAKLLVNFFILIISVYETCLIISDDFFWFVRLYFFIGNIFNFQKFKLMIIVLMAL